ncbi:hypothetical protein FAZ69_23625 [Trinickia terrae]|uniref:Uncharacterized protein n=1 Tax=Trinickia terrae TaxID=2571161 RepID=A0A4V5PI92_9BURK|nr:hypothetical protein FAZ69_23625 [Trinickia terrae]
MLVRSQPGTSCSADCTFCGATLATTPVVPITTPAAIPAARKFPKARTHSDERSASSAVSIAASVSNTGRPANSASSAIWFAELNDWLGEEVVQFDNYEISPAPVVT